MEKKVKKIKVRLLEMEERELPITTEFIKLEQALKFCGTAETGGHAKILIEKGAIRVNGETCLMRGKKLRPGDSFEYKNQKWTVK